MACLPPWKKEEPFTGVRCELCGELLWIGRFGLVCQRGHGPIVHRDCDRHEAMYPELRIEHDKTFSQQGKMLRGALVDRQK